MTKVIHVQLIQGRKSYYFGSIPAIYSVLSADDIGKGGVVLNKKAIIKAGEFIRSKKERQEGKQEKGNGR